VNTAVLLSNKNADLKGEKSKPVSMPTRHGQAQAHGDTIFFHPDYTVGAGITPAQFAASLWKAKSRALTAGQELCQQPSILPAAAQRHTRIVCLPRNAKAHKNCMPAIQRKGAPKFVCLPRMAAEIVAPSFA
jgi:hypothetical protein